MNSTRQTSPMYKEGYVWQLHGANTGYNTQAKVGIDLAKVAKNLY